MEISKLAYELYKVDWMRRISAERQLDELNNYFEEIREDDVDSDEFSFEDYIFESGYSGELYVCYDEFLEAEYLDKDYMKSLLSDYAYDIYLKDIGDDDEE